MKLYNLFQNIIFESKDSILNESVKDKILDAMNNTYNVWFKYREENGTITDRYVQIHQLGMSKANNEMISAYQLGGQTTSGQPYGWKQFRLDRIVDGTVKPTGMTYQRPISDLPSYGAGPKYNPSGNKNMRGNITTANFKK